MVILTACPSSRFQRNASEFFGFNFCMTIIHNSTCTLQYHLNVLVIKHRLTTLYDVFSCFFYGYKG